jgi:hypothetical protein
MSSYDLRKHLNQRVTIRVQNVAVPIPGVVKFVDGVTLTLRRLVPAGQDLLQSEEIEIPCTEIVSISPDKWQ